MNRIISFSEVSDRLEITPALSPSNRCAYVKTATDHNGTSIPNSPANRLIWYVEKNVTYYSVKWHPNDTNGGTWSTGGNDPIGYSVADGTRVDATEHLLPQLVAPTGYTFGGWYVNNTTPLTDQLVNSNTDVYAHWVSETPSTYTITWDKNGGSWADGSLTKLNTGVAAGSTISNYIPSTTLNAPSGKQFAGWYINGVPLTNQTLSGDVTVTATWENIPEPVYTIIFVNDDGQDIVETRSNVTAGTTINKPTPDPTPTNPQPGYIYDLSGWILNDGVGNKYLGKLIKKAQDLGPAGTYTFIAEYNGKDLPDNHVKILDNIGKLPVKNSEDPKKTRPAASLSGDIGQYWDYLKYGDGWFSGPMDGHSDDVCGKDGGISPTGSSTGRRQVVLDGVTYTSYDADSIVYEFLVIRPGDYVNGDVARISGTNGYKTVDTISATDLITQWNGYDGDGNKVITIKSNDSWIRFAVIANLDSSTQQPPLYQPISFKDPSGQESEQTVSDIPISIQIVYYVADNSGQASRVGTVTADVYGQSYGKTDCIYVSSQTNPHTSNPYTLNPWSDRSYMTTGNVYFYQLGQNYTPPTQP